MKFYAAGIDVIFRRGLQDVLESVPTPGLISAVDFILNSKPRNVGGALVSRSVGMRDRRIEVVDSIVDRMPKEVGIIVDSGAFTILRNAGALEGKSVGASNSRKPNVVSWRNASGLWISDPNNLDAYVDVYIDEFIPYLYDRIEAFVEPDFHLIVDKSKIESWRSRIKSSGMSKKCILVDHGVLLESIGLDPWEQFLRHADKFISTVMDFSGWAGVPAWDVYKDHKVAEIAKQIPKVHAFGLCTPSLLMSFPYATFDSFRWHTPLMWGRIDIWDSTRRKFVSYSITKAKSDNLPSADIVGLPVTRIGTSVSSLKLVLIEQLKQYSYMQNDLTRYWELRKEHEQNQVGSSQHTVGPDRPGSKESQQDSPRGS